MTNYLILSLALTIAGFIAGFCAGQYVKKLRRSNSDGIFLVPKNTKSLHITLTGADGGGGSGGIPRDPAKPEVCEILEFYKNSPEEK